MSMLANNDSKWNLIPFRFLKGAEICGLNKKYKSGELKDFLVEDLENFENSGTLIFL